MALAFRVPDQPIAESSLARRCRCRQGLGSRVKDVHDAARHYGLAAQWLANTGIEAETATALRADAPVLANVQLRVLPYHLLAQPPQVWHTVLLVGLDDRHVYLHDPDPRGGGPWLQVARAVFFACWTRYPYSAYRV
jgi:hypothetical protein